VVFCLLPISIVWQKKVYSDGGEHSLVEDDSLNRDLICKVLRQEGHGVVEACDGEQAIELFCARNFDLVISDFVMPKVDGFVMENRFRMIRNHCSEYFFQAANKPIIKQPISRFVMIVIRASEGPRPFSAGK
jgi:CheY-like chemotaxis protein